MISKQNCGGGYMLLSLVVFSLPWCNTPMDHMLIFTIIGGLVTAFIFGVLAVRLRLPAIFGYLLAGVLIGPHTPGFIADTSMARQLSEIGIILLMFGVGLHFSFKDLRYVRKIAFPGALAQMVAATFFGGLAAVVMGYSWAQGLIFGFALSVASTIVLIRALEQFHLLPTPGGKIALGWLIIEDLAMVVALVTLPGLAGFISGTQAGNLDSVALEMAKVMLKVGAFVLLMIVVGRHVLPRLLRSTLALKNAELELLCSLALALGFAAVAYVVFDASFALGAFLAGMMLNASKQGHDFAERTVPVRDAFSVLFFVSVGMLFNPLTLLEDPLGLALTVCVIIVVKSLSAVLILHFFRQDAVVKTTVALGLSQIGEFSFILGGLGVTMGLIPVELFNLLLGGALLSIVINPFLFKSMSKFLAPKAA